jgi:ribosomal protein L7/L12
MSIEADILTLRARVGHLEEQLNFVYQHLGIGFQENLQSADSEIMRFLRKGLKIQAVKLYRQIYHVGLGEAVKAVNEMEEKVL